MRKIEVKSVASLMALAWALSMSLEVVSAEAPATTGPAVAVAAAEGNNAVPAADTNRGAVFAPPIDEEFAQRWAERNARYQELRGRAQELGVDLPANPPWGDAPAPRADDKAYQEARAKRMEEQRTRMNEKYQQMKERAKERGMELPDTKPWENREQWQAEMQQKMKERREMMRKHMESMTDEQREMCHLMHSGSGPAPGYWGDAPEYAPGPGPWGYPGYYGPRYGQ